MSATAANGAGPDHVGVAIVGSGFSGLGMAIRLLQEGVEDFAVLEQGDDVGGTWRDNTYPGCRCDVPSHVYSFSFAPNPEWSNTFSPQPEILDYLRACARRYGVLGKIRFGHAVTGADWDDAAQRWTIRTSGATLTADALVGGTGPLVRPMIPDVAGLGDFTGTIFHSSRWDHEHDLTGERVAVIGTGASAIQFVPEIQPRTGSLHVFQRTAPWVMPRSDRPLTELEHRAYRRSPALQQAMRGGIFAAREALVLGFLHPQIMRAAELAARLNLRREVADPALRARLTPDYTFGCKRVLISDDWYRAIQQPNTELVSDGIREVRERSIVTADGREREVDTIILGTGFHVTDDFGGAAELRGRDGVVLGDLWADSARAHRGTMVAGFPNLFLMVGPNTALGHNSIVYMIESQIPYVLQALRLIRERRVGALEPRPEAQDAWNREVDARTRGTVWVDGGCRSYYLDRTGRNATIWPGFSWQFRRELRRFDPTEHVLRPAVPAPVAA